MIYLRAVRKCINVVLARSDPQDLARPIGLGQALAEQGSLPQSRRVRRDEDVGKRRAAEYAASEPGLLSSPELGWTAPLMILTRDVYSGSARDAQITARHFRATSW